jgi:hypothetical protein
MGKGRGTDPLVIHDLIVVYINRQVFYDIKTKSYYSLATQDHLDDLLRSINMATKVPQHLVNLLHPYQFVLKEGDIEKNRLDYRLMLLQVTCPEVIKSPLSLTTSTPSLFPEGEMFKPQHLDFLLT